MKRFFPQIVGVVAGAAALLAPATTIAQTVTSFSPTYGRIGSSVVIKGTGFFSAGTSIVKSVLINGADMQITATDVINGTITVKVPPTASTGVMRITTTNGSVATSGFRVTRLSTSLTFNTGANPTTPGSAGDFSTPCLADLDDDGLLDLIIGFGVYNGAAGSGTLQRYEQSSATDANFSSSTTLTPRTLTTGAAATASSNPAITVSNFAKPFVTDLDGDGLLDLLVGENNGTVLHYEQNSTAFPNNFSAVVTLFANPNTATPTNRYYARPTVVDLDRDGLLDILVGASDGFIYRYEQATANANTTAGFTALGYLQDVTTGTGVNLDGGDVSKAQVLDIEGDGLLDLLVGNTQGTLQHYVQSAVGAATFTRVGSSTSSFNGIALGNGQYSAPVMADIDGDGLLDLLLGNYNLTAANVLRYEQVNNAVPTPLPVTLTAFSGQVATGGAQLRWTTAQEVNSAAFVVERSMDGRTFSAVAERAAAGTSAAVHNYQYLDASVEALGTGTRYYRLRQVDQDGTAAYSSVVTLTRSAATSGATTVAYPNPFENELLVALPSGTEPQAATVTLTSLTGQQVYKGAFTLSVAPQALTALPALSSGVYVLRLTTAAGTTTQRVSRQ